MLIKTIAAACLVCASAATLAQATDTLKKITDSGKITLAYRESSVPFSYLAGGLQPIGMSVDLSNAVTDAVKKTPQYAQPQGRMASRDIGQPHSLGHQRHD